MSGVCRRYLAADGSVIIKPNRFSVEWNDIGNCCVRIASTQCAQCVLYIYNNSSILAKRNNWNFIAESSKSSRHFSRIFDRRARKVVVSSRGGKRIIAPQIFRSTERDRFDSSYCETVRKSFSLLQFPSPVFAVELLGQNPFHGILSFRKFPIPRAKHKEKRT